MRKILQLTLALMLAATGGLMAQGVTSASINGKVIDSKGEALPGATVIAVHVPSGTQYGSVTRTDGHYNFPAVRVGGPYTITVTFVGYQEQKKEGIELSLGQNFTANITLGEGSTTLNEIQVLAERNSVLNADRTGAMTNIRKEQFERLPTIGRSFQDFSAMTPQAGSGFSFGGRSNLYNNFSIDGSTSNNVFGLSALPGGQTGAQPISVDAIQEISVSLAPYDVRQGAFTGAGVNAVTRSGTNEFSGSIYGFTRNESLVGKKVEGVEQSTTKFNFNNAGFRLGGPIIKNKLFFFVNYETEKRTDPAVTYPAGAAGNVPTADGTNSATDLAGLRDFLIKNFQFDPGSYENFDLISGSQKYLAKLDWNISQNHKLTVRYNQLSAYQDKPPSSSGAFTSLSGSRSNTNNSLPFSNSYYRQHNDTKSVIAELNSTFGNKFSNTFTAGYTAFRDYRKGAKDVEVPYFPTVDIAGSNGNNLTTFGVEPFTANNKLNQDVIQINDNFNIYLKDHTLTIGTANEHYKFYNAFTQIVYGNYRYSSIAAFEANAIAATASAANNPTVYQIQYSTDPTNPTQPATFKATQLGLYVQDEYTGLKNLKLTAGLRVDMPIYSKNLPANPASDAMTFTEGQQYKVGELPKKVLLYSPRVGFNWDVLGDKTLQVRGGTGVFTGRIPFVWLSNQATNNGIRFGAISASNTAGVAYPFKADPAAYVPTSAAANASYQLNVTDPNFKFPQVWRSNLAVDKQLPLGLIGTVEAVITKDIHAAYWTDANLSDPVGTVAGDGRPLFGQANGLATVNAPNDRRINDPVTNAIALRNTNKGYSWSVTGQLQRTFDNGFYAMAAYTYTDARDLSGQSGSTASSNWNSVYTAGNLNYPVLSYSGNLTQHRVIFNASYRKEYLEHFASTISFIYTGRAGDRFSYRYGADMNSDGQASDLIYIPRSKDEILLTTTNASDKRTTDEIWQQLDSYINQDKYLSKHRGEYASRNGAVAPWVNNLNARFLQDFYIKVGEKRNTLQLSFEVINVLNLISSDWGLIKTPARSSLLGFSAYETANTATAPATGRPVYTFASNTDGSALSKSFINVTDPTARWQMQFGLRYIFN